MIAFDPDSLCREAKTYYYDFLYDESRKSIPQRFIEHIEGCTNCQGSINKLAAALSQAEEHSEPEQEEHSAAVATMLRLHLAYIGERVTCDTVKPFLPGLLHPALEIRIPTPITAHLDNCQECTEDLERIRELGLNREQLCRLSQLFAQKATGDSISCSQAQARILAVVSMALHETTKEVLKHLCTCRDCREALYQCRETVREQYLHEKSGQEGFPCNEVSAADLFDYVIPYGLDPARDEYARFRTSFTSHVRCCPTCLAKIQHLHSTVYAILERAESDVVTIYYLGESAKTEATGRPDDLYAGFPIRVEVTSHEDARKVRHSAPIIGLGAALKQKLSRMNLISLAKVATVAAVVFAAITLLLNSPTAKGVSLESIYKAIETVRNAHISSFVSDKQEPIQEIWVSRALNVYVTKGENRLVLWDVANRLRKDKHLDTGIIETMQLADDVVASIKPKIAGFLDLVPFSRISEVPHDAEWIRVTDVSLKGSTRNIEVYDLTWGEKAYDGSIVFKKWRVFLDPTTKLPQRTEFYEKSSADSEYNLRSVKVVESLSDSEIQEVIEEASS
jgi:hypothetical protein